MGRFVKPFVVLATLAAALNPAQAQQDRRVRVDVQHYVIDAEINPETQTIAATAQVRFVPQDATSSVSFDLNNAMNVSRIVDGRRRTDPRREIAAGFQGHVELPRGSPERTACARRPLPMTASCPGRKNRLCMASSSRRSRRTTRS